MAMIRHVKYLICIACSLLWLYSASARPPNQSLYLNNRNVTLKSPGYDQGQYPKNTEQSWQFSTDTSKYIRIRFEDFQVESHPLCLWDYVGIYSGQCPGSETTLVVRLCGEKPSYNITVQHSSVCVKFVSDTMITKKGFAGLVIAVEVANVSSPSPENPSSSSSSATSKDASSTSTVSSSIDASPLVSSLVSSSTPVTTPSTASFSLSIQSSSSTSSSTPVTTPSTASFSSSIQSSSFTSSSTPVTTPSTASFSSSIQSSSSTSSSAASSSYLASPSTSSPTKILHSMSSYMAVSSSTYTPASVTSASFPTDTSSSTSPLSVSSSVSTLASTTSSPATPASTLSSSTLLVGDSSETTTTPETSTATQKTSTPTQLNNESISSTTAPNLDITTGSTPTASPSTPDTSTTHSITTSLPTKTSVEVSPTPSGQPPTSAGTSTTQDSVLLSTETPVEVSPTSSGQPPTSAGHSTTQDNQSPQSDKPKIAVNVTMCEDTVVDVVDGLDAVITTQRDNKGHYKMNSHCLMTINNTNKLDVDLQFRHFDVEYNYRCVWDYVTIETNVTSGQLCGNNQPASIYTEWHEITVLFHSDHIVSRSGFILHVEAKSTSHTTATSSATHPSTTPTGQSTTVLSPSTLEHPLSTVQTPSPSSPTTSTSVPVTSEPSATNTSSASSPVSISSAKSTSDTPIPLTSPSPSIKSSASSTVHQNASTLPITSSSKSVPSSTLAMAHTTTTTETITQEPSSHEPTKSEVSDSRPVLNICETQNLTLSKTTTLVTPGYVNGEWYPNNVSCTLHVSIPQTMNVSMTIEYFEVEKSYSCSWDYLRVQFGHENVMLCGFVEYSQQLGQANTCGTNYLTAYDMVKKSQVCVLDNEESFTLSGVNNFNLTFNSDFIIPKKGFNITLRVHPPPAVSSSPSPLPSASSTSSSKPFASYSTTSTSFSKIPTPTTVPTSSSTSTVSTTSYAPSTTESETSSALPKACSSEGQPYSLTDESGYIESPGYQKMTSYPPNSLCKWNIQDDKNKVILLIFESFDVELSNNCRWDKLAIYERAGNESDYKQLAVLCGDKLPHTMTSIRDVLIEFKSDTIQQKRGFKLRYIKTETQGTKGDVVCPAAMVPCLSSGTCIPIEWLCDGDVDCNGGDDEKACSVCKEHEFRCSNGACLHMEYRCDGVPQCPYAMDEYGCVFVDPSGASPGSLSIMLNGASHPLCHSANVIDQADQVCKAAGLRSSTSLWPTPTSPSAAHAVLQYKSTDSEGLHFTLNHTCKSQQKTNIECFGSECGLKHVSIRRKRIIGGSLTSSGEWPWTVALRAGNSVICGATIIDALWVMTAGHCVQNMVPIPHAGSVVVGVSDINDVSKQTYYVTEVVLHPEYNFIFNADIALLRLNRPIEFGPKVKQICLPWNKRELSPSSRCYIAGWGLSNMTEYHTTLAPRFLRHVKTKIVRHDLCQYKYANRRTIKDTMICAGYAGGGKDACKGDSGGALMCDNGGNRWTAVGVISWGDKCGSTDRPGVYTRVTSYIDWIDSTSKTSGISQSNVNCTFESSDWCGYTATDENGLYYWARQPGGKFVPGWIMYASTSVDYKYTSRVTASLLTADFNVTQKSCLIFSYLFTANSNVTLSVHGIPSRPQEQTPNASTLLLWHMRGHYPSTEAWRETEVDVPFGTRKLMFNVIYENGAVSGLGLDNVILALSACKGNEFLKCDFNDGTFCNYINYVVETGQEWQTGLKDSSETDFVAKTGGSIDQFQSAITARLLSPSLSQTFSTVEHCLQFSFKQNASSSFHLQVATYTNIGGDDFANQVVVWSSKNQIAQEWATVKVNIRTGFYYDNFAIEVFRDSLTSLDNTINYFMIDDISVTNGACIQ